MTWLIFFSIIIFTYLNVFISNQVFLSNASLFENITIVQIFTPVLQVILAVFIAYYIHIKIAKRNESVSILIDILDKYLILINEINEHTLDYIRDKKEEDAKAIMWKLKKASVSHKKFELIYGLFNDINFVYSIREMKKELLILKRSITDDPFKQKREYTAKEKTKILENFENIETNILKEKINLYK